MNTTKSRTSFCPVIAFLALLPILSPTAETDASTAEFYEGGPQTHVLFTSTNIQVDHRGALREVRGVDGSSFLIRVGEEDFSVSIESSLKKLTLSQVLTLSERWATVTDFKFERVYTAENDPFKKATGAMLNAQAVAASARAFEAHVRMSPETTTVYAGGMETKEVSNPIYETAVANLDGAQKVIGGNMGNVDTYAEEMSEELARQLFDAIEMQFEVSSPEPVSSAYLVMMARFHEKDIPGRPQIRMIARNIGPIDPTPRKVSLIEGGFPPGYVLEKVQLHLYDNGVEIATDLSENRAMLTQDEAHEYLVVDYINSHEDDTLPARIAMAEVPEGWAARFKEGSMRKTCYAKVDETGRANGFFIDADCTISLPDHPYADFVDSLRFFPALKKGNPIDSVARIKLSETPL